jgi:PAS domain S-box-containing protein
MSSTDSRPTVLLAINDPTIRSLARLWLQDDGCRIIETETDAAVEWVQSQKPNLVVLSAEAVESCIHLRSVARAMPILVVGANDQHLLDRAFEVGADDYMSYPVHPMALCRRVRHLLLAAAYESLDLEDDCEEALELRIQERTAELSATNEALAREVAGRARIEDALRKSQAELEAKTQSLTTLNQIADTLHRSLDFQTVVERALDVVMSYTRARSITFFVTHEPSDSLLILTARGISQDILLLNTTRSQDGSLTALAAARQILVTTDDLANDTRIDERGRAALQAEGFKSAVALPLLFHGRVLGVIGLFFKEPYRLSTHETETLLAIGGTIALAIVNAQHLTQVEAEISERQQAEAAEREHRLLTEALRDTAAAVTSTLELAEVLDLILAHVARVVPHDAASIMLVESGIAQIVHSRGFEKWDLDQWVLGIQLAVASTPDLQQMLDSGRAHVIPDTHTDPTWTMIPETRWIRSYVGAPICIKGEVIGFLNVDSATPHSFSQEDADRLQTFADQTAIAIQNARLYDTIRNYADELEHRVTARTAELESERAQLRAILDGMREGVMGALNYDGRIPRHRYVNWAMQEMLGYSAEEWNPLLLKSAAMTDEQFMQVFEQVERAVFAKGVWKGQLRLRRKDGLEFDSEVTITRVDGPDGVLGSVMLLRDISEEKALQEQKDRFVAHASHELRTPITNLKTRLYLMSRQPERIGEHIVILEQVADRMQKLVEDLLDLSRFRSGVIPLNQQPVVVQDLIAHVLRVQQPEADIKGVRLERDLPPADIYITADSERMIQVITNLVTNAVNYTPEGGYAQVIVSQQADGSVVIEVRDSGIGISPEHLPYIFQPFYRVGQEGDGTGLGLSISKDIVERHGGTITVESEPGRGSRFAVRLKPQPVGTSA